MASTKKLVRQLDSIIREFTDAPYEMTVGGKRTRNVKITFQGIRKISVFCSQDSNDKKVVHIIRRDIKKAVSEAGLLRETKGDTSC